MDTHEAVALIEAAVPGAAGTWADFGAGDGTFTRALVAMLGKEAKIYAVDRDARAIASLRRWATREGANVVPVEADFTRPLDLAGLDGAQLDGFLVANALHFVRDADVVLRRLVGLLRPAGRAVIVEYDRRAASRWVPYPIAADSLRALAASAGLSLPTITARRPSAYGGVLYVAAADRVG